MSEDQCLGEWSKTNYISTVNQKITEYARPCNFEEKCLNENTDGVEDKYERSIFNY